MWNTDDLARAQSDFAEKNIERLAWELDVERWTFMSVNGGWDRETGERQRGLTRQEMGTKELASKMRSPECWEKAKWGDKGGDGEMSGWEGQNLRRLNVNGFV